MMKKTMISRLLAVCLIACAIMPIRLHAQQGCNSDPYFSKLDFWVGEWDVYDGNGNKVGSNVIKKNLKDCVVEEYWTDAMGGKGKSLFYVERNDTTWHQIWVSETATTVGGQKHKVLVQELENGGVVFQGNYFFRGRKVEDRTTLTPKADGSVEQLIERSMDGGKTWNPGFLGIYRPKNNPSDEEVLRGMHQQYIQGWKEMNEEMVLSLFEENATLQPNRLKPIQGMENIKAFWFPDDGSVTKILRFDTQEVAFQLMDTLAIATYTSNLDWSYLKGDTSMAREQKGVNTVVYRKQSDGSWKIWRRMWTDIYSKPK